MSYAPARRRQWWLLLVVAFTAIALPTSWLVCPKVVELYSNRQQRKKVGYEVRLHLDAAQCAIKQQEWSNARIEIDLAILAKCANPTIFTPNEICQLGTQIDKEEMVLLTAQENTITDWQRSN